jgi:hypothetical protein
MGEDDLQGRPSRQLTGAPAIPAIDEDPETALLMRIVDASGGRLPQQEAHQVAREVGLKRAGVATHHHHHHNNNNNNPPWLVTGLGDRVLTDARRARIAGIRP